MGWLSDAASCENHCQNIIADCKELISKDWHVTVCHVYREGNAVADGLANLALLQRQGFHELLSCPSEVVHLIRNDEIGIA